MEGYLGKIYTPIVFGDAAPGVPSFIGSKVIFWWKSYMCTLQATFLDRFLSNLVQMCIIVKSTHLHFFVMLPPVFRLL